jgi:hypothetical protein
MRSNTRADPDSVPTEGDTMGHIQRLFLWLAGVDVRILMRDQESQADVMPLTAQGGAVLVTSILAGIGGYIVFGVNGTRAEALAAAVVVAGLFLAFDRFLLLSIQKIPGKPTGRGSKLWRLMLSIVVAYTVASPLLTRFIFPDVVYEELERMHHEHSLAAERQITAQFAARRSEVEARIIDLEGRIDAAYARTDTFEQRAYAERKGIGRPEGAGPQWRLDDAAYRREYDRAVALEAELSPILDSARAEYSRVRAQRDSATAARVVGLRVSAAYQTQLKALYAAVFRGDAWSLVLQFFAWKVLLILFDAGPVLLKLSAPPCSYDRALHTMRVRSETNYATSLAYEAARKEALITTARAQGAYAAAYEFADEAYANGLDLAASTQMNRAVHDAQVSDEVKAAAAKNARAELLNKLNARHRAASQRDTVRYTASQSSMPPSSGNGRVGGHRANGNSAGGEQPPSSGEGEK